MFNQIQTQLFGKLIAQGDTGAVMSSRGDLTKQGAFKPERLAIGVRGSVLTTDGTDPIWSNAEAGNVKYVANSGSDSNPGTEYLPYKTINYALSQATSGDIIEIDTISGGTGGTLVHLTALLKHLQQVQVQVQLLELQLTVHLHQQ